MCLREANRQNILAFAGPGGDGAGFLGKTDYDLFPEEYADIYYRLEREVFEKNAVASELQVTLTPDGGKRWVDNRKYPIRNKNGEIIGLFGVAQDITERMDALEGCARARNRCGKRRESRAWAAMSWTSPTGYGRVRMSWTKCSESAKSMSARLRDGLPLSIPTIARRWLPISRMRSWPGKPFDREYRIVRQSDGAVRWVHGLGRLEFDAQGRP